MFPFRVGSYRKQYTRLERHGRDKHSSLFGPFIRYEQYSFVNTAPGTVCATFHFALRLLIWPARVFVPGKSFHPNVM